jgi:hypothetical protein
VLGEVVALVHRPQLEPLIFHAGSYKSLTQEPLSAGRNAAHLSSTETPRVDAKPLGRRRTLG